MERDRFTFLKSYKTALDWLDKDEHLDYLLAIIDYGLEGKEPTLQGALRACFELIRPIIDNSAKLSDIAKENGEKGGAPKGNQNARKQPKTTEKQPKTTQNKLDKEKDKDMDKDMECVTARAREFCDKYKIKIDTPKDTHTENLDFDALDKAYSQSANWLQKCPSMLSLKWIVKNYDSILSGIYADFKRGGGSGDYGYGGYKGVTDESAAALNAAFAITSPDEL